MDNVLREKIKQNIKESLFKHVKNFKYKNTQPLDLLIPMERKIRSIVGGLETSMGTTVWEPIARTLAQANGFEIITEKILSPDPFPVELAADLSSFITRRENRATWVPMNECIERLKQISRRTDKTGIQYVPPASGTGVDIHLMKEGKEYAFDTKTVKPNLADIKGFNKELLEWYTYRICKEPEVDIQCKIAYPYNPWQSDFWKHAPHKQGLLKPKVDAVVEDEFWDFISGLDNTFEQITLIFKELYSEGFGKKLSDRIAKIHTT